MTIFWRIHIYLNKSSEEGRGLLKGDKNLHLIRKVARRRAGSKNLKDKEDVFKKSWMFSKKKFVNSHMDKNLTKLHVQRK